MKAIIKTLYMIWGKKKIGKNDISLDILFRCSLNYNLLWS